MDNGVKLGCIVVRVTGGGKYNYGLNVRINEITQDSSDFYEEDDYYNYTAYDYDDYYGYDDEDYEINRRYANDPCYADPDMCCGYDH